MAEQGGPDFRDRRNSSAAGAHDLYGGPVSPRYGLFDNLRRVNDTRNRSDLDPLHGFERVISPVLDPRRRDEKRVGTSQKVAKERLSKRTRIRGPSLTPANATAAVATTSTDDQRDAPATVAKTKHLVRKETAPTPLRRSPRLTCKKAAVPESPVDTGKREKGAKAASKPSAASSSRTKRKRGGR